MVNNDTEIEIKIPVTEEEFDKIKENVRILSKFVKRSHQLDLYFTPPHKNFLEPEFPFEWLSVRSRDGKSILNYKHYYPEDADVKTHCDEFETELQKPEQFDKIFSSLEFKKLVTVEKNREVYVYGNEFEIGLDDVKDLGKFVEIESIKNFGSVEATRKKLFDFAKILGIDVSKTDKRGYPFLLMKKKGLIKN
jgi:predicted adenylyl cyclase CyaB